MIEDRQPELAAILEQLLGAAGKGWDYGYDIGPSIIETPQGPVGGYLLIISCRSPVLDPPRLSFGWPIPTGWPTEAELKAAVEKCLATIALRRNALLQV